MKEIILVFKTHLDIGFTDLATNVVNDYMQRLIPKAIQTAMDMRARGKDRFMWTVGSWLIDEYLRRYPDDALLPAAIERGDICWHAMPFTTHTELMDARLFQYGLHLSNKLDARFGIKTTAGKMSDVTGHTRALVPHAVKAGIRFLHIGVNIGCPRPEVPVLFRWAAPTGETLFVMYQQGYGQFQELGDSGIALYFAHTNDNDGPPKADEVTEIYARLRKEYPEAYIHAGTLDDVANVVCHLPDLPVVTQEIGDTWIYGAGSDPLKVSRFRAILRACEPLPAETAQAIYQHLILVPEHTWGMDEKLHLGHGVESGDWKGEHDYFIRKDFEAARGTAKCKKMEASWAEQRQYVQNAIDCLHKTQPVMAEAIISETTQQEEVVRACAEGRVNEPMQIGDYTVTVNENGAICGLTRNGVLLADDRHLIGAVQYQAFSEQDFNRYYDEYAVLETAWLREDIGKIGCGSAIPKHLDAKPTVVRLWYDTDDLLCELCFEGASVDLYGAPKRISLSWRFLPDAIHLDARWHDKAATRVGEAIWVGMHPISDVAQVRKLSEWINPADIVPKGNRRLHATDYGVMFANGTTIETLDAALVTIGQPALLRFPTDAPSLSEGVFFNLYNNLYGTNFPMWYDEDARFRFTIHLGTKTH